MDTAEEKETKEEQSVENQDATLTEETTNVENETDEDIADEESTLETELKEAKDKYLRLYSEFENFRRRTAKEKLELIASANKDLMESLLPVVDDLGRALEAVEKNEDFHALKEGMKLINDKFIKTIERKGLKSMKVKKGDDFDDKFHEAITQIPAEKELEGKIVDVVEHGYKLGETIVRFAKVVVGAKQ